MRDAISDLDLEQQELSEEGEILRTDGDLEFRLARIFQRVIGDAVDDERQDPGEIGGGVFASGFEPAAFDTQGVGRLN